MLIRYLRFTSGVPVAPYDANHHTIRGGVPFPNDSKFDDILRIGYLDLYFRDIMAILNGPWTRQNII